MPIFDNRRAKVSLSLVIIGAFILAVLLIFGLFIKAKIHDTATNRLKYKYPDGYKEGDDLMWCYHRTDGEAKIADAYYVWNLTNLDEVLSGGNAHYNLLGPYMFSNHTCEFDWRKDGDFLRYRTTSQGFVFLPEQSHGSPDDLVTNINPGYLGLLKAAGSESGIIALMTGGALKTIITTFQKPETIQNIQALARPTVLAKMNTQVYAAFAAGVSLGVMTNIMGSLPGDTDTQHNIFFNNETSAFPVAMFGNTFRGYANFVKATQGITPPLLSNEVMSSLVGNWSAGGDGSGIVMFVQMAQADINLITAAYDVDVITANLLYAYAGLYLMSPATTNAAYVAGLANAQWANATRPQINLGGGLKGWEVGYPTPSGLSAAVVVKLFDPTFEYSLTNDTTGVNFWIGALLGNVTYTTVQAVIDPSITEAQFDMIRGWLVSYTTNVVPPLLLKQFGITDWNDFAYAQWGSLVLGKSVGPAQKLTYYPEVAAYDPTAIGKPASCVIYNVTAARNLLNGTQPLMNPTNMAYFFTFASKKQYAFTENLFGLSPDQTDCLFAYLSQVIAPKAVVPVLTKAQANGGGLFTTRTVQQMLFNAQDPLLALLGQPTDVSLVANNTRTQEQAMALDPDYIRIYNGHNDLFGSLQVPDYGQTVHGFWAEDIQVIGYNGSQFMPYDYVKKPQQTLQLWHRKVMKPVKIKYYGMTKWNGLDLAYLGLDPLSMANDTVNPANAKFFAHYGGLINESSFITNKGLPVFLSLPNFLDAEPAVTENLTLTDTVYPAIGPNPTENKSRHPTQVFVLVEPFLGTAVWGNVPIQANLKYGPTDLFYTNIKPNFAPVFWNAIGDKATDKNTDTIKNTLYRARTLYKVLIGVGVGFGGILVILGAIGLVLYKNKYSKAQTGNPKL